MELEATLGGDGSVSLTFSNLPLRARLAAYARNLASRRMLAIYGVFLGVPLVSAVAVDSPGQLVAVELVMIGGLLALVVVTSLLATVLATVPPNRLTFSEAGISEERPEGTTLEHPWSWVVAFASKPEALEIEVRPDALRSFRLAPTRASKFFIEQGAIPEPMVARLTRLLRAHAAGVELEAMRAEHEARRR